MGSVTHHRDPISGNIAVGSPDAPASHPALISQRAELLGQISGAQQELSRAIEELRRAGGDTGRSEAQLDILTALQGDIATASPSMLARLSWQIAVASATAARAAQEASNAASAAASQSVTESVLAASEKARQTADRLMAGMKEFDPYLRFSSAEDESEYRERERARREQIEREEQKGTPQGNLAAVKLAKDQMLDAGAHGADQSPDFAARLSAANDAITDLQPAVSREAQTRDKPKANTTKHDAELAAAISALSSAGVKGPPTTGDHSGHGLQVAAADIGVRSI